MNLLEYWSVGVCYFPITPLLHHSKVPRNFEPVNGYCEVNTSLSSFQVVLFQIHIGISGPKLGVDPPSQL